MIIHCYIDLEDKSAMTLEVRHLIKHHTLSKEICTCKLMIMHIIRHLLLRDTKILLTIDRQIKYYIVYCNLSVIIEYLLT